MGLIFANIRLIGTKGAYTAPCLVDTGFDGELIIPEQLVWYLGPIKRGGTTMLQQGKGRYVNATQYTIMLPQFKELGLDNCEVNVCAPDIGQHELINQPCIIGNGALANACVNGGDNGKLIWRNKDIICGRHETIKSFICRHQENIR